MIGLLIGNIVMTLFFMFHSITAGSSLRNARYFNEGIVNNFYSLKQMIKCQNNQLSTINMSTVTSKEQ
jgi:hypothetical protein